MGHVETIAPLVRCAAPILLTGLFASAYPILRVYWPPISKDPWSFESLRYLNLCLLATAGSAFWMTACGDHAAGISG